MIDTDSLINLTPREFTEFLKQEKIPRFYIVYDPKKQIVKSSHPQLQAIADFIQNDKRDFMKHEGAFFQITRQHDILQGAFIHRTNRGQAAGGVRFWHYNTVEDYLRDGLRLGKGMTRKNALAGLWWGGGKGVMVKNQEVDQNDLGIRSSIYREYGKFISSLRGCYVTAEDVGTNVNDMANVFSGTRFTTCIPKEKGGSGNPSVPTARGVISGMEAALEFCGKENLHGKTIAVQGMGNVGDPLIGFLFKKGVKKIIACDTEANLVERIKNKFQGKGLEATAVSADDMSFFKTDCDILSPNATGGVINPRTIPLIKAKIICGAANNQLEDSQRDDKLLFDNKIIYIPDFLTNRMGIVNAADEQYGYVNSDPLFERHLTRDWKYSIYQTSIRLLKEAQSTGEPTAKIAMRTADRLSMENHPLFGHRGQQIIDSLIADKWHLDYS